VEVTVIRSPKRRKTAQARMVAGRLEVRIPARSSKAEEARFVETFRRRFERAGRAEQVDLGARARTLARRFDLPEPAEIRWVTNQDHRWGSCTPSTGVIRISDRLAHEPLWVIDHVVVHELAHLVVRRHDARFRALIARYPLAERAEGYLIAKAGSADPTADPLAGDEPIDDEPGGEPIDEVAGDEPSGHGASAEARTDDLPVDVRADDAGPVADVQPDAGPTDAVPTNAVPGDPGAVDAVPVDAVPPDAGRGVGRFGPAPGAVEEPGAGRLF
jgi:hypothetical protein